MILPRTEMSRLNFPQLHTLLCKWWWVQPFMQCRGRKCSRYSATNVLYPHALWKGGNVVTKAPHSYKLTAMQTTGYELQFLQMCWSPNEDTDCYYRHFRNVFSCWCFGEAARKESAQLLPPFEVLYWINISSWLGRYNGLLVSATCAVKALLLWWCLVSVHLLIWRGIR